MPLSVNLVREINRLKNRLFLAHIEEDFISWRMTFFFLYERRPIIDIIDLTLYYR